MAEQAERHVVIVDFNHMVHTYYNSQHRLSIKVVVNGEQEDKDTTVQSGTLKSIFRWSNHGYNPTAVCFDRPVIQRKVFFQTAFPDMVVGSGKEYKGNRERMPEAMMEASRDVQGILQSAGVSCYAQNGYESDDIIMACIKRAKVKYPGMHIDIVTNDADLLPLVDDTISVYLRSKKGTFAENKKFEKTHYIEVTPRNYQQIVENLSAYKGFTIPYNCLLLHKLLRGDPSDQFGCKDICRMFPASKWNAMIAAMEEDGIDFSTAFRYGEPVMKILYRGTDKEFKGTMKDALASPDKANLYQKVCNPKELDTLMSVLRKYSAITDEQADRIEKVYWGMNLNMTYPHKDPKYARRPFVVGENNDLNPFKETDLQNAARVLQIKLL